MPDRFTRTFTMELRVIAPPEYQYDGDDAFQGMYQPTANDIREYVKEAVTYWGKQFSPDSFQFQVTCKVGNPKPNKERE